MRPNNRHDHEREPPDTDKEPPVPVTEWAMRVKMEGGMMVGGAGGLEEFNADLETLISLSDTAQEVAAKIKDLEKTNKELKKLIEPLARKMQVPRRLMGDTWELRYTTGSRSTILREELIARGVPAQIVEDSTEVKTWDGYAVYPVKPKKDKKGEAQ